MIENMRDTLMSLVLRNSYIDRFLTQVLRHGECKAPLYKRSYALLECLAAWLKLISFAYLRSHLDPSFSQAWLEFRDETLSQGDGRSTFRGDGRGTFSGRTASVSSRRHGNGMRWDEEK